MYSVLIICSSCFLFVISVVCVFMNHVSRDSVSMILSCPVCVSFFIDVVCVLYA